MFELMPTFRLGHTWNHSVITRMIGALPRLKLYPFEASRDLRGGLNLHLTKTGFNCCGRDLPQRRACEDEVRAGSFFMEKGRALGHVMGINAAVVSAVQRAY